MEKKLSKRSQRRLRLQLAKRMLDESISRRVGTSTSPPRVDSSEVCVESGINLVDSSEVCDTSADVESPGVNSSEACIDAEPLGMDSELYVEAESPGTPSSEVCVDVESPGVDSELYVEAESPGMPSSEVCVDVESPGVDSEVFVQADSNLLSEDTPFGQSDHSDVSSKCDFSDQSSDDLSDLSDVDDEDSMVPQELRSQSALFPSSPVATDVFATGVMLLCQRHNLTYACQNDILKLMSMTHPTPNTVPRSSHLLLKQFVNLKDECSIQHFCGTCLSHTPCTNASCSSSEPDAIFIRVPLVQQLKERMQGSV